MTDEKKTDDEGKKTGDEKSDEKKTPSLEEVLEELGRVKEDLRRSNGESADRRREIEKLKKEKQDRDDADLSELEKEKKRADVAEARADAAEKKIREVLIRAAVDVEASKLGAAHPEDAYRLVDLSKVEVGDDDTVSGVADVVKSLVESGRIPLAGKPTAPNLDGAAGNEDRSDKQVQMTAEEISTAKKLGLSVEEYAKSKSGTATGLSAMTTEELRQELVSREK